MNQHLVLHNEKNYINFIIAQEKMIKKYNTPLLDKLDGIVLNKSPTLIHSRYSSPTLLQAHNTCTEGRLWSKGNTGES